MTKKEQGKEERDRKKGKEKEKERNFSCSSEINLRGRV